jgi:hypothetical protein
MESTARRLHRLVEPIHLVTYFADEPTDAFMALGHRNVWDGYFAGRAAPLGRSGTRPLPRQRSLASRAASRR